MTKLLTDESEGIHTLLVEYLQEIKKELGATYETSTDAAFVYARRIVSSEALYKKALERDVNKDVLVRLSTGIRILKQKFKHLDLSKHERFLLLDVFRNVVQAGIDSTKNQEENSSKFSGAIEKLLIHSGIHVESLGKYVSLIMSTCRGRGFKQLRDWFPGGKFFDGIQRQRVRWGNEKFVYDLQSEIDPQIAHMIHQHYLIEHKMNKEEALAKLHEFIQQTFSC